MYIYHNVTVDISHMTDFNYFEILLWNKTADKPAQIFVSSSYLNI